MRGSSFSWWWVALALVLAAGPVSPAAPPEALPAPEWEIVEWLNGDPGSLADLRGTVVVLHFFQMACEASDFFTVPQFRAWGEAYADRDDIRLIGIHSPFAEREVQTAEHLRAYVLSESIAYPVGIDIDASPIPRTMRRYDAGGSPHTVIIDKSGRVRFSRFGYFEVEEAERLIETLSGEVVVMPTDETTAKETLDLSGQYRFFLKQREKSCGRPSGSVTLKDTFITDDKESDELTVAFSREFLGRKTVTLPFDRDRGELELDVDDQLVTATETVPVRIEIRGWLPDEEQAAIEFRVFYRRGIKGTASFCDMKYGGKLTKTDTAVAER